MANAYIMYKSSGCKTPGWVCVWYQWSWVLLNWEKQGKRREGREAELSWAEQTAWLALIAFCLSCSLLEELLPLQLEQEDIDR